MPTLQKLTVTADAIAATTSKLKKTRLPAEPLSSLNDDDLYWATHFFSGNTFALNSGQIMQGGFPVLQGALQSVTGADEMAFSTDYLKWRDVGDTTRAQFRQSAPPSGWNLTRLGQAFERIAATLAGLAKSVVVTELLRQLGTGEVRYVAKILTADLHSVSPGSCVCAWIRTRPTSTLCPT